MDDCNKNILKNIKMWKEIHSNYKEGIDVLKGDYCIATVYNLIYSNNDLMKEISLNLYKSSLNNLLEEKEIISVLNKYDKN